MAKAILRDAVVDNQDSKLGRFVNQCDHSGQVNQVVIHNYDRIMKCKSNPYSLLDLLEEGGAINTKDLKNHNHYPHRLAPDQVASWKENEEKTVDIYENLTKEELEKIPEEERNKKDTLKCIENTKDRLVFSSSLYYPDYPYVMPKNRMVAIKRRVVIDDKLIAKDPDFYKHDREKDIDKTYQVNDFEFSKIKEPKEEIKEDKPKENNPEHSSIYTPYNVPQLTALEPSPSLNRTMNRITPYTNKEDRIEPNYAENYTYKPYDYTDQQLGIQNNLLGNLT
jgi:hypothetical protein